MHPIVRNPTGACPVPIEDGPTDPEILDWFDRVRRYGLERGRYLTKSAIIALASTLVAGDEDLPHVRSVLRQYAPEDDAATPIPRGGDRRVARR